LKTVCLQKTENALVRSLERDRLLTERVNRLMTTPAVGPITALTRALEAGDVKRFSSIKKAISYCGLCSAEKRSADIIKRTPLFKQRSKHLQCMLIEAAKLAPRNSSSLALVWTRSTVRFPEFRRRNVSTGLDAKEPGSAHGPWRLANFLTCLLVQRPSEPPDADPRVWWCGGLCQEDAKASCCTRDEGRPLGAVL